MSEVEPKRSKEDQAAMDYVYAIRRRDFEEADKLVRKHLGYSHIPGRYAQQVSNFTVEVLSPYLNFHRPCLFPEEIVDARGKRKKRYPYANLMTPYEKFKSLPAAGQYLKPGITFKKPDDIAMQDSDNEAARHLNKARDRLFREINKSRKPAA